MVKNKIKKRKAKALNIHKNELKLTKYYYSQRHGIIQISKDTPYSQKPHTNHKTAIKVMR